MNTRLVELHKRMRDVFKALDRHETVDTLRRRKRKPAPVPEPEPWNGQGIEPPFSRMQPERDAVTDEEAEQGVEQVMVALRGGRYP